MLGERVLSSLGCGPRNGGDVKLSLQQRMLAQVN